MDAETNYVLWNFHCIIIPTNTSVKQRTFVGISVVTDAIPFPKEFMSTTCIAIFYKKNKQISQQCNSI